MQLSTSEQLRYLRQINLEVIGEKGQLDLKQARVLVVGAGGLGAIALPYLVAAGIGSITIVDDDKISLSNLTRQVFYQTTQVGQDKVKVMQTHLEALNPNVKILAIAQRLNADNASDLLQSNDLVLDASDNFETRYVLNDVCEAQNKAMVYGAVSRFEGQVAVFSHLDKHSQQKSASYRCAFPEVDTNQLPCEEEGVLGVLPGIIGLLQANEVLKILLGVGEILQNRLLYFNALNLKTRLVNLKRLY